MVSEMPVAESRPRFVSIDALRGFDMFLILGADLVAQALPAVSDSRLVHGLAEQLEHVPWSGFHFYDLIFPLFVFLVGVSTVFSLDRILEKHGKRTAYWRVIRRSLILYALGLFYYGGLSRNGDPEMFRYVGVLQRIAICYLFGGLLYINFRWRGLLVTAIGLLVGYWALLSFVPVPGVGPANFDDGLNLANYVDTHYLPGYKWDGDWDPEGLLSTIPAIAGGLMGIFAGLLLRNQNISNRNRILALVAIGVACVAAGYGWHVAPQFGCPIIKKLWTPSFVLYASGWSYLLVALFHAIIDIGKFDIWARPFVWIGMNPITLYVLGELLGGYSSLVERILLEPVVASFGAAGPLVIAVLASLIPVWIAWIMYRERFFIRV